MHTFRNEHGEYSEPAGHFGGLRTTDVVGWATGNRHAIQLAIVPPGGGGDSHKHDAEQQTFIVLDGTYRFRSGEDDFVLHKGDAVLFEPGEYHATVNESDRDVVCLVVTVKP